MNTKEWFDSLHELDKENLVQGCCLPEEPGLSIEKDIIVSERRYDRYHIVIFRDSHGKLWRTDKYAIGGDSEFRGFTGSIHPLSENEFDIIKSFCDLSFVSF